MSCLLLHVYDILYINILNGHAFMQQTRLEKARDEGGIEDLEFRETKTPFLQQIQARVQALEISDA